MSGARHLANCLDAVARASGHPTPLKRSTFKAWRVLSNGNCLPVELGLSNRLDDAADSVALHCSHGQQFFVMETPDIGDSVVTLFQIMRESKPKWRTLDGEVRPVRALYHKALATFCVSKFDPVQPWQWSQGADPVGGEPFQTIEGFAA